MYEQRKQEYVLADLSQLTLKKNKKGIKRNKITVLKVNQKLSIYALNAWKY